MKTHMNIPVFIPHLGCPHDCAFCNQKTITNNEAAPSPESVAFSVRAHLATRGKRNAEIAFFGGSFTGIPRESQAAYLSAVQPFLKSGEVGSIRISTRPDFMDRDTVAFLKSYGVKTVELGAQSMSDAVLRATNRGHTAKDTERAARLIVEGGLTLGLQMMTGLPLSTREAEEETARAFVSLGAKEARIYPTVVFYDTALCLMMETGAYVPPSMEETVERAASALSILEAGGVNVIRVGLQETETLGAKMAGGAYHPAMGEMVRARLWRNRLEKAVSAFSDKDVTIWCDETLTSLMIGQKKENLRYLAEKYGVTLTVKQKENAAMAACGGAIISLI